MNERRTVLFDGEVQGVGFRANTARFARGLALTGTVRNLADGRVELVAEGSPAEADLLIHRLREYFGDQITDLQSQTTAASGDYSCFAIRY